MTEEEEKEYIEHEIVDRLYYLEEKDFDKAKVDDSYIQAVIKAGKENKKLIEKLQKENKNALILIEQYSNEREKILKREYELISKDIIRKFIKEELPDDEIMKCCENFDVNGVYLRKKLEELLGE